MRIRRGILAGVVALAAIVSLCDQPANAAGLDQAPEFSVSVAGLDLGGPFALVTHEGRLVTDRDIIVGPTLIYFGYTFCPDVCPVDMQLIAEATDLLAEQGVTVRPVFVTIDPERDTPAQLAWFVEALHPTMVGLTGTQEQIDVAAKAYKVFYQRHEAPGSAADYLFSHTSYTYLMLPEGVAGLFRRGFTAQTLADEVERILRTRGAAD